MKATRADAYRLMHEGAIALSAVESAGMRIDTDYLHEQLDRTGQRIDRLHEKMLADPIWKTWKRQFKDKANIGSRTQLGTVLFDVLRHTSIGQTKSLRHRTDEEALESIDLPFVRRYLEVESLKKLRATNIQGILREVKDGYASPFQNLHIARSYRSSTDHFNSQNIPTRDEQLSSIIRPAFIPRPGRMLVEVDFKGAEVCLSACYHHDPKMIEYITDPTTDMHRDTAGQIFKLRPKQITKPTRQDIKSNFVFAEFYGAWYKTCAPRIWKSIERYGLTTEEGLSLYEHLEAQGITELGDCDPESRDEPREGTFEQRVKQVERNFWERRFRVYNQWKQDWFADYLKRGYFDMLTGFRCSGVMSKKEVCNYPIQGSAFHCLLWCLIQLQHLLRKYKMKSLIIAQIHDSMLLDALRRELKNIMEMIEEIVTVKLPKFWPWICVPMTIEVEGSTENWYLKKPLAI